MTWTPLHQTPPDVSRYVDFTAVESPGDEFHYRIRAVNSVGNSEWVNTSVTRPTRMQQWLFNYFGTTEPTDYAAWNADPDGDGIANLLEYALGGHPLQARTASIPVASTMPNGTLAFSFTPANVNGLRYFMDVSTNLYTWQVLAEITNELSIGIPYTFLDFIQSVEDSDRFLRLRVESSDINN